MIDVTGATGMLRDGTKYGEATLVVPARAVGALTSVVQVTRRLDRLVGLLEQREQRIRHERQTRVPRRADASSAIKKSGALANISSVFGGSRGGSGGSSSGGGGDILAGLVGGVAGNRLMSVIGVGARVASRFAGPLAATAAVGLGGYEVYRGIKAGRIGYGAAATLGLGAGALTGAAIGATLTGPLAPIGAAIGALVGVGAAAAYNNWTTIKDTWHEAVGKVSTTASNTRVAVTTAWSTAVDYVSTKSQDVVSTVRGAWNSLVETTGRYRDNIEAWLARQGGSVSTWLSDVASTLRSSMSVANLRSLAADWLRGLKQWLLARFGIGTPDAGGAGDNTSGGTDAGGAAPPPIPPAPMRDVMPKGGDVDVLPNRTVGASDPGRFVNPIDAYASGSSTPSAALESPGYGLMRFAPTESGINMFDPATMRASVRPEPISSSASPVPTMFNHGGKLPIDRLGFSTLGDGALEGVDSSTAALKLSDRTSRAMHSILSMSGLSQYDGKDRRRIMEYLRTGGHGMDPTETAWCAATVGSALRKSGLRDIPANQGGNVATSYARWGRSVHDDEAPKAGDVAIFMRGLRPGVTGGHVMMATGRVSRDGRVELIGGNTGHAVKTLWADPNKITLRRATEHELLNPAGANDAPTAKSNSAPYSSRDILSFTPGLTAPEAPGAKPATEQSRSIPTSVPPAPAAGASADTPGSVPPHAETFDELKSRAFQHINNSKGTSPAAATQAPVESVTPSTIGEKQRGNDAASSDSSDTGPKASDSDTSPVSNFKSIDDIPTSSPNAKIAVSSMSDKH